MPKVDLKLYSTDSTDGKKLTTTVTYINPEASNAALKEFSQKLNALTKNIYYETDRVETVNVDTQGSRRENRNVEITNAQPGQKATITANSTGSSDRPTVFFESNGVTKLSPSTSDYQSPTITLEYTIPSSNGILYVAMPANDYFYATFVQQTVVS